MIGALDERDGAEVLKAIVVPAAGGASDRAEIIDFCRGQLAGYKRPRSVDFIAVLPRNPSGKVLERELRAPYWKDRQRGVN